MSFVKLVLKPGKEQSVKRFHPWIFSGAVSKINGTIAEGDIVEVVDHKGEFLAIGYYQIGSISVRILSFKPVIPDRAFWLDRIQQAVAYRSALGLLNSNQTNVFRLINAEGDGFPGLIIDYYNGTAVFQSHTVGMYLFRDVLIDVLREVLGDRLTTVFDKSEGSMPFKAKVKAQNGLLLGTELHGEVMEYGNRFNVDWNEGQKTGFFIDQRENRKLVEQYAAGKNVLNMFGYTGGFSVYAMRGNAALVHSVDVSKKATAMTTENIALNFGDDPRHEAYAFDCFEYLTDIRNKYDLIILDPPAFAKHTDALHNALQAYKRLNQKAMEQIKPGGILFTFSCSQVVSRENFRKSVFAAAANSGRRVSIMHQLTQPACHPISMYHPEGEYLKGLVCYVE